MDDSKFRRAQQNYRGRVFACACAIVYSRKAIGLTDADLAKPMVGIANTWIETMPCNSHLRGMAEYVKAGVRAAGGTPLEFNTIAISDGETMGAYRRYERRRSSAAR